MKKIILFIVFILLFNMFLTFDVKSISPNLTSFNIYQLNTRFSLNSTTLNITKLEPDEQYYVYHEYSSGFFTGNYNVTWESYINAYDDTPFYSGMFMVTNILNSLVFVKLSGDDHISVYWYRSTVNPYEIFLYLETNDGVDFENLGSVVNVVGKNYCFALNKTSIAGNKCNIVLNMYNDTNHNDLYKTLTLNNQDDNNFKYMYIGYSDGAGSYANKWVSMESKNYTFDLPSLMNVSTNASSNVEDVSATLNGYLNTPSDNNATIRFQYGTTIAYGTNTTNQTIRTTNTLFSSNITGLSYGTLYHYRSFGNNSFATDYGDDGYFLTKPNMPNNLNISILNSSHLRLNWTKGTNANNTYIIKKTTSPPSDITDGDLIYNGTGTYVDMTYSYGETLYLSAFSYANYSNPNLFQFSRYGSNFTAGGLYINCYEETTLSNLTFNISISNEDGSQVYNAYSCVNTKNIQANLLPQGNINILISSPNHKNRTYALTIISGIFYVLNAYLPNETTQIIQLCRLDVVGPQTEYGANPPIENALVELKAYDNNTGNYQTVTSFYTDANGQYFIYLITNTRYLVNITKTDYENEISIFIVQPDVVVYTFRLTPITIISIPSYDLFSVNISFVCIMLDGGGYNQMGNITINYNDINLSTVDTDIYLYSYFNGTLTYINTWHNIINTVSLTVGNINTTRTHVAMLYYNNTASFSDMSSPFIVYVNPVNIWSEHARFDINERITNIVGPMVINGNVISWADVLAIIPAVLVLVLLGPFNTGVAIIGTGLALGFSNVVFAMWFTNAFPILLVTAMPIIIVIGVLYIMSKQGGDNL